MSTNLPAQKYKAYYPDGLGGTLYHDGSQYKGHPNAKNIQCVFEHTSFDIKHEPLTLARSNYSLSNVNADLFVALIRTEGRDAIATASLPLMEVPIVLVSKTKIKSLKEIGNRPLSTARGSNVHSMLEEMGYQVDPVRSYIVGLQKVQGGRAFATVLPSLVIDVVPKEILKDTHQITLSVDNLVIYVSNDHPEHIKLLHEINHAIVDCRKMNLKAQN